jgi:hypothetical protein
MCGLRTPLDDKQIPALDLRHNGGEGLVDYRVERGVANEVVSDVDLEAFVLGDGGCEGMKDVCEGREGAFGKGST